MAGGFLPAASRPPLVGLRATMLRPPLHPHISNIYHIKYQPPEYCLHLSFSRPNDFLLFPSTKINEENVLDYT